MLLQSYSARRRWYPCCCSLARQGSIALEFPTCPESVLEAHSLFGLDVLLLRLIAVSWGGVCQVFEQGFLHTRLAPFSVVCRCLAIQFERILPNDIQQLYQKQYVVPAVTVEGENLKVIDKLTYLGNVYSSSVSTEGKKLMHESSKESQRLGG